MFAKLGNVCQRFLRGLVVPENNKNLAKAVRDWIDDTGLTQAKISALGGPSSTTVTKILSGTGSFRQAVFGQLDRGLGWGDGGAMAAWRGEIAAAAKGFDWRGVSDQELLGEVERRMKGGQAWGGDSGPEDGDGSRGVTHLRPTEPPAYDPEQHAARKGKVEPSGEAGGRSHGRE